MTTRHKARFSRTWLGVTGLLVATTSAAQDATALASVDTAQSLQAVTVTGHYANAVGTSDAASQGVVLGGLLRDRPLLRPGEVLETVPGMVVTQHSGDGKANQYFLRGYNLDHGTDFATSVDNVPVNMPTNAHGQGYSDLNFLIPELVDRIDYAKGPYFAVNGDFSSAGSAAIHYCNNLDQNLLALTVGSDGYRRLLAAGSTAWRPASAGVPASGPTLLAAVESTENNGPWDKPEHLRKLNTLLRLSNGDAANGWSADGMYYKAHWDSTDQVPLELIQSDELGRYQALDPTDGGNTERAILSGEWHSHDADGYTKLSTYAEHYRLQLWSNFTFYELRPDTGDQFEQAESRNLLGAKLAHGWNHSLWGHESVSEVGLQVRYDHIDVSLQNTQARIPFETVTDNLVKEAAVGAYVQNSTAWTSWFRSVAGLRTDRVDMDMTSYSLPVNSGTATGHELSPKLALIFGPWASTELFLNAGRGFHSNDARGVINKIDPTTGTLADAVPALVGSTGKEVGVRTDVVPGLQSSLALWSLDSNSELIYAADSAIGSTEANGASQRWGVEWNNHWVVNDWLLFDADFAYTHARYASDNANGESGDDIPNAVTKVASVGVTLVNLGDWSGSLHTRYIGPYPLSQDGSLRAPSAIVTNVRIQRQWSQRVTLALDTLNLFNRKYYDIAYEQDYRVSPTAPIVPDGITVHPGEPRQFRVTLMLAL